MRRSNGQSSMGAFGLMSAVCALPWPSSRSMPLATNSSTAFHADLWPRRKVSGLRCGFPASPFQPQLFVSCSSFSSSRLAGISNKLPGCSVTRNRVPAESSSLRTGVPFERFYLAAIRPLQREDQNSTFSVACEVVFSHRPRRHKLESSSNGRYH